MRQDDILFLLVLGGIVGFAAWALVRALAWVVDGFLKPKVAEPEIKSNSTVPQPVRPDSREPYVERPLPRIVRPRSPDR